VTATVEVAIVGAGVTGLSVAFHLRERGVGSVVVLERSGIGAGASGVQPGGVRQQWGTEITCRLAREAAAFWREADELLASPVELGFRPCGYLFVAHSEETLGRLRANVAVQNAAEVPSRIVSAGEAAELVPGLQADGLAGAAWCEEDGYFDRPQSVVEAFAAGTEIRVDEATELRRDGDGWRVETRAGTHRAGSVVVAAGADTVPLVAPHGAELPIERERRHLFLSEPVNARLVEPLVVSAERGFAAKQLGSGRVLASDLRAAGDAESGVPRWRARVREVIEELLPVLEYVDFPIVASGDYDVTPDRQPILGALPGAPGLHVAAGFSGHGFMLAPAVARILADELEGRRDEALDVLDAGRFAAGRLVPEPQVV